MQRLSRLPQLYQAISGVSGSILGQTLGGAFATAGIALQENVAYSAKASAMPMWNPMASFSSGALFQQSQIVKPEVEKLQAMPKLPLRPKEVRQAHAVPADYKMLSASDTPGVNMFDGEAVKRFAGPPLLLTIALGIVFTGCQALEYYEAALTISDGYYGTAFYMATGFHGFHVLIGTIFLAVQAARMYRGQLAPTHHIGFQLAAWYWHFVDVVWLFVLVSFYEF